jgi:hypothetical protein
MNELFATFRKNVVPSSSRAWFLEYLVLEDTGTTFFRNVGTTNPVAQPQTPERLDAQLHNCEKLKSRIPA